MTVRVERASVADGELIAAVCALVPQLSESASVPDASDIAAIVNSTVASLLVARDESGTVLGMLTVAIFRIPTGVRAWIEDVVVDERARGQGVGSALVDAALELASDAGAKTVDLTSRPTRESAHRLYQSLGFEERTTTVYRKTLA